MQHRRSQGPPSIITALPPSFMFTSTTITTDPDTDQRHWQLTQPAVSEGGQISLRGLPPVVVLEVLFGVQQRVRGGAKILDVTLRTVCNTLRREQVPQVAACPAQRVPGKPARALLAALGCHVRRALTDPGHERGGGASNVRTKVNALARLAESLRIRADHGLVPERLGRPDIEAFLNRLAYLESTGTISRYHRNTICRGARAALAGIRALGLTRPGRVAAGLPGDFALGRDDIPAEAHRGEPGRDLPPEIMAVLSANLDGLRPAELKAAIQIGIDTGRRPEDILNLPLECLQRDKGGEPVLVYDNAKADRLGRRLPINEATAAVITAQQSRVKQRFPATPAGELKLLPSPRRNPDGRRPMTIAMLGDGNRRWVDTLGPLHSRDGAEFDKSKIVPYAYRHSYAQRHADAGVGIDVLAELLDHRNLNVTRGYYRVGEDRRRAAVDTVTAMSFDRHGNRVWREAAALLDSEHARHAAGEVAVPYGRFNRAVQRRRRGRRLPGPVPLRRLRPLPHRRVPPARPHHLPRRHAANPLASGRRHRRRRRVGPRRRHPQPAGDHPDPAAHRPHRRRSRPSQCHRTRRHRRGSHRDAPPPRRIPRHAQHPGDRARRLSGGHRMTNNAPAAEHSERATAMRPGRQADSARRRQRVLAALNRAATDGTEISAASIARAAGVDRSFLYRHRDLLAQIHALEATPPPAGSGQGPGVTRASLQADLLAAGDRALRLTSRIRQLETRLSKALGEQAWHESGLGVPADLDALNQKINNLE